MKQLWMFAALALATAAAAGDRLLATGGAQQVEGAGGSGLVPWAVIAGYGTNKQVGGSAFITRVVTDDFDLQAGGVAVGLYDRFEVSFAKQSFDASAVIPGLKLKMETLGFKVKVFGDAVSEQDSPWPQVSIGAQHKRNSEMAIPTVVGAVKGSDTDIYLAATKLWLGGAAGLNVLGNITLRATRANQFGLLGFGGDRKGSRSIQPELTLAVMMNDQLAIGIDHRWKPDNLRAFKEGDASDVFIAWFPSKNLAVTAAYARLGTIAGKPSQSGAYLSLQLTL
ncbi:MAG: DUF3034 family protein [Usitatibacter sp.]